MKTPDDTYDEIEDIFNIKINREKIAKRGNQDTVLYILRGVLAGIAL